jgi:sugar phosphate isomerase/epimerase
MQIDHIGFSFSAPAGFGALRKLEEGLDHLGKLGYTLIEINPQPFAIIMNGEIRRRQLENFGAVLRNFSLRYSIHGYNRLNLAYDPRHELCKAIMRCQIEICQAVGAQRLVYHSGLQALDDLHNGVRATPLSEEELDDGARREAAAFQELAPLAEDAGVVVGMENGDSHRWEHALMARFGLPREALLRHHARLQIAPIVRQLEAIDHPAVGMTLDIAHLHIAAHDMGFSYLDAVAEAAPWVVHLHANDNFGKLDTGFDSEPERWPYGEADIHLPPGWGSIPYVEVFRRLPDYQGDLVLEIKAGFADYLDESLETMKAIVAEATE